MANVKWIKIVTDIFNNKKIKQIDSMPDADAILVIWFKLICLAGNINADGLIVLTKDIAYTDEMLATEFRKSLNTVRLALKTFEKFGMIEIVNDIYRISNWEKYQNVDRLTEIREYNRLAKQRERENKKLLESVNDKSMTSQRCQETDIDIDIDKEVDIDKDKKPKKHKYGLYNNVLLSDEDYQKLLNEFPLDYQDRIERLSEYIASKGTSYKNHLATIRSWARKDKPGSNPFKELLRKELEDEQARSNGNYDDYKDSIPKLL